MAATYGAGESTEPGLERGAIGLTEVLFQSITHMAPAVATALSIGFATTFAGGITPLAVVFALIAALFTAYSVGQLARHLPSAGGMYTYVSRGLGSFFGWLMAWAFTLAEPIVPAALYASFGLFGASFITELTGFENDMLWLPLAVLCGLVVWFLVYRGISLSTRIGVVLGVIEIGIFLVVAVLLVANAETPVNTASVFIPGQRRLPAGLPGHGVLPARVRRLRGGCATRRGDQGAEAHDPARGHPLGTPDRPLLHLLHVRGDRVLRPGPDASRLPRLRRRDPWSGMAEEVLPGIGGLLVTFAIINSSLANANAGAIASTRVDLLARACDACCPGGSPPCTRVAPHARQRRALPGRISGSCWRSCWACCSRARPQAVR